VGFILLWEKTAMAQARTLKERELKQLLGFIGLHRHALRNRIVLLLGHWAGMRVGEIAALRYGDVLAADATILHEIRLSAEQTKGSKARVVYLPEKLRKELLNYVRTYPQADPNHALFYNQKNPQFTPNALAQLLHTLYRAAGLNGASSHSGRRSFITNLASKGVGIRVLQALAGHRDIRTTAVYIEANDAMKRAAVELV
jgi:integrase/recombinase XerD